MSSGPPVLTDKDIREELGRIYGADRKRFLVAFYGSGSPGSLQVNERPVEIIPVRSELELRERVPKVTEDDPSSKRIAFLVPFATQVPLDLAGLFAKNGRVLPIGRMTRLQALFGASELEADVLQSPLADYLLASGSDPGLSVAGRRLTLSGMWDTWLEAAWKVPTSGGLGLDALMGWAATANSGAVEESIRTALAEHLEARLGPAGPVVWAAWEKGLGEQVLRLALVFDGLRDSTVPEVGMWTRLVAKRELGAASDEHAEKVARDLGRAAGSALRLVELKEGVQRARAILRAADDYPTEREVRAAAAASSFLPSAWRHRLDVLGAALKEGAKNPTKERVDEAIDLLGQLERHRAFKDEENQLVLRRIEMALRLLAWLASSPHRDLPGSASPHADVESIGRWYSEQGGFVDWARGVARGLEEDQLGVGVQAVVEAADRERTDLDLRFARALVSWYDAGRPANQVLPIDDAVRRVAVKFLEEKDSRKLLVLLLDGMAWAQAVELLGSLGGRAAPWGPIAWHASKGGRIGEGLYPVTLAAVPTTTEVSRAAFFAGKPMKPGAAVSTEGDPGRWAENGQVARFVPEGEVPRLLLRSEGHTAFGSASREALNLVGDERHRIVAVVINAIDASLRGDTQERHRWTVDTIKPLGELLDKAREVGRVVMLASDHGHVPSDRLQSLSASPGAGARYRPWTEEDRSLAEYEVALTHETVWRPRGARGVVALADDAHRYGGQAVAGVHGGATLAEVVAPCLIIGCEDHREGVEDDRDLTVRPAHVPEWWHFDVASTAQVEPEEPRTTRTAKKSKAPDERQLPLLEEAQPTKRKPSRPPVAAATPSAFESCDVLKARAPLAAVRKQVAQAVVYLRDHNGAASEGAFASAMDVLPFRIGGLISKLQEVLNLDGYQVLRYDREARQVYLDLAKLREQFEVEL